MCAYSSKSAIIGIWHVRHELSVTKLTVLGTKYKEFHYTPDGRAGSAHCHARSTLGRGEGDTATMTLYNLHTDRQTDRQRAGPCRLRGKGDSGKGQQQKSRSPSC